MIFEGLKTHFLIRLSVTLKKTYRILLVGRYSDTYLITRKTS